MWEILNVCKADLLSHLFIFSYLLFIYLFLMLFCNDHKSRHFLLSFFKEHLHDYSSEKHIKYFFILDILEESVIIIWLEIVFEI